MGDIKRDAPCAGSAFGVVVLYPWKGFDSSGGGIVAGICVAAAIPVGLGVGGFLLGRHLMSKKDVSLPRTASYRE